MTTRTIKQKKARSYNAKTLKIVFSTSMNECAFPNCSQRIVEPGTSTSDDAVLGEIAHIHAISDDGPRSNPNLSEDDRNHPDNLIVLCPTHHALIDKQHESYPPSMLLEWKAAHLNKFRNRMGAAIGDVGFQELELTARNLLSKNTTNQTTSLLIIPPEDKISKNMLGTDCAFLLKMGATSSNQVASYLLLANQLEPGFADRLRDGFVHQYIHLSKKGLKGDELFLALNNWAGGTTVNEPRKAAGLCILSHLFIICDIFEK